MDKILTAMHTPSDILSQLVEDLEIARLCNNDESLAQAHFVQYKVAESVSGEASITIYLDIDNLSELLKAKNITIPKQSKGNSIINLDLGKASIEIYRHDYVGSGYLRLTMFGEKSAEYKVGIVVEKLVDFIADLPMLIESWLSHDYESAKVEAQKLLKQQKISRISTKTLLESILNKLEVTYSIEHLSDHSEIDIELANSKQLHVCVTDSNFANEIGKISELVRTAKEFSLRFANATIINNSQ